MHHQLLADAALGLVDPAVALVDFLVDRRGLGAAHDGVDGEIEGVPVGQQHLDDHPLDLLEGLIGSAFEELENHDVPPTGV